MEMEEQGWSPMQGMLVGGVGVQWGREWTTMTAGWRGQKKQGIHRGLGTWMGEGVGQGVTAGGLGQ